MLLPWSEVAVDLIGPWKIAIVDTCCAAASYAARSTIHSTLRISPGAWVFQRDMILNIPLLTDLQLIHQR